MATIKTTANYSLDSDLVEELRKKNINMSGYLNELLRKNIGREEENLELLKEKTQKELEAAEILRVELREKLKEIEKNQVKEEEQIKIDADKARQEAKERLAEYKKKIELEISYFPTFIKNGFLSSQSKREKYFIQRAKLLKMPLEDYLKEVVEKAGKTIVI
jgi:outer membrane translocation and assembly module TamA